MFLISDPRNLQLKNSGKRCHQACYYATIGGQTKVEKECRWCGRDGRCIKVRRPNDGYDCVDPTGGKVNQNADSQSHHRFVLPITQETV